MSDEPTIATPLATVEDANGHVIFEGPEEFAYKFVENNAPRIHAEPGRPATGDGGPTALLVVYDEDGVQRAYVNEKWETVDYVREGNEFKHRADVENRQRKTQAAQRKQSAARTQTVSKEK